MAPNKKKKTKPQSNPARGFATTSQPSKSQVAAAASAVDTEETASTSGAGPATNTGATTTDSNSPASQQSQSQSQSASHSAPAAAAAVEQTKEEREEAQLQELVEKYGSRCRKESLRWAERYLSERRMHRSAAASAGAVGSSSVFMLYVEGLLGFHRGGGDGGGGDGEGGGGGVAGEGVGLGRKIFELAREEAEGAWSSRKAGGGGKISPGAGGGDQAVIQSWMLLRTFTALGFDEDKVERAIENVVGLGKVGVVSGEYDRTPESVFAGMQSSGGGDLNVGVMEEVLDWLAMECEEEDLPRYDGAVRERVRQREEEREREAKEREERERREKDKERQRKARAEKAEKVKVEKAAAPPPPPPHAGGKKELPIGNAGRKLQSPPKSEESRADGPSLNALEPLDIEDGGVDLEENPDMPCADSPAKTPEPEVESDADADLPPDEILPKWVELKRRLYLLDPSTGHAGARKKKITIATNNPQTKKLRERIVKIEKDPFFDTHQAGEAWLAEKRRLRDDEEFQAVLTSTPRPESAAAAAKKKTDAALQKKIAERRREVEEREAREQRIAEGSAMFGDMFEQPTEEMVGVGPTQERVVIRDFEENVGGDVNKTKFTRGQKIQANAAAAGSVRKVVEEVVKSKDVNAKVTIATNHGTTYSVRHALTIKWTKVVHLQSFLTSANLPTLEFEYPYSPPSTPDIIMTISNKPPTVTFEMKDLSASTALQSEAYICSIALYHLYGGSSNAGGKGYMRLQGVWRSLWAEFVEKDRLQGEKLERQVLAKIKRLVVKEGDGGAVPVQEVTQAPVVKKQKKVKKEIEGEGAGGSGSGSGNESSDVEDDDAIKADWEKRAEGERLRVEWEQRENSPAYQHMLEYRKNLPMWAFKEEVLNALEREQVIIICGETGCGKSTQVPAFILENELSHGRLCRVYCTEPRRISAISLARRVSEELGDAKADLGTRNSLVGFAIRLESCMGSWTRLIYATTGIVMRMLERSPELEDVTHLVLDEVHERSIDSDFLLIVLKKLLLRRRNLKVVLMSATVDAERFSKYLGNASILTVPGRTFPVSTRYLEDAIELTQFVVPENDRSRKPKREELWDDDGVDDEANNSISLDALVGYSQQTKQSLSRFNEYHVPYELIVKLIETIANHPDYQFYSNAILVFLPGIGEIRKMNDYLLGHPVFGGHGAYGRRERQWLVYPLHSTIASEDQEAAFLIPPKGVRKIVLATNIAETGITIPDVTCVIDSGKHKEMRFDERRQLSRLIETFISRANAKQRRGRAGRVQEGLCFHLFTKERHDKWMADQQTPEMTRLSLQDLVLRVKVCKLGAIEETLTSALDPPLPRNIRRAVDSLIEVKALTSLEELTPLGRQLAKLPLDVYLGKLVLFGWIHGCLDAAITIAAMLSSKSPFFAPMGMRKEADAARMGFKRGNSDLLTIYSAYCSWRRVCQGTNMTEAQFCQRNYLSSRTLSAIEDLKGQLITCVVDAGFLTLTPAEKAVLNRSRFQFRRKFFFTLPDAVNHASEKDNIVNSVVAAGFYPKLLVRDGKGWRNVANNQNINIHVTSVNRGNSHSTWLTYYGIMQSTKFYDAHDTSHVDDIAVALLCGDAEFKLFPGVAIIDGNRIRFTFQEWKSILAIKILRNRLARLANRAFRERRAGGDGLVAGAGAGESGGGVGGGGGAVAEMGAYGKRWMDIASEIVLARKRVIGGGSGGAGGGGGV